MGSTLMGSIGVITVNCAYYEIKKVTVTVSFKHQLSEHCMLVMYLLQYYPVEYFGACDFLPIVRTLNFRPSVSKELLKFTIICMYIVHTLLVFLDVDLSPSHAHIQPLS